MNLPVHVSWNNWFVEAIQVLLFYEVEGTWNLTFSFIYHLTMPEINQYCIDWQWQIFHLFWYFCTVDGDVINLLIFLDHTSVMFISLSFFLIFLYSGWRPEYQQAPVYPEPRLQQRLRLSDSQWTPRSHPLLERLPGGHPHGTIPRGRSNKLF